MAKTEPVLYGTLAIFPPDVRIPQSVIVSLWCHLNPELTEQDCQNRLQLAARDHYIIRLDSTGLMLSAAQHARCRDGLDLSLSTLHAARLTACNPQKQAWWNIPENGYWIRHLSYHFAGAEHRDGLVHVLIDSPQWMDASLRMCGGCDVFLQDVAIAFRLFHDPLTSAEMGQCVRLSLVKVRAYAWIGLYTNQDLQTLVKLGRLDEARSHIRLTVSPRNKIDKLRAILEASAQKYGIADARSQQLLTEIHAIIARLIGTWEQDTERRNLIRTLLDFDQIEDALVYAQQITQIALFPDELIRRLAQDERFDEAMAFIRLIPEPTRRVKLMIQIATEWNSAKDPARKEAILGEAKALIERVQAKVDREKVAKRPGRW